MEDLAYLLVGQLHLAIALSLIAQCKTHRDPQFFQNIQLYTGCELWATTTGNVFQYPKVSEEDEFYRFRESVSEGVQCRGRYVPI